MTPLPQAGTALFLVNRVPISQINGYLEEAIRAQFNALEQTSNWRSERTSELFEIGIGKTPPRKEPEWFSNNPRGNFVWLSIKDMGEPGAYSFDSSEYLTPQAVIAKNVRRVPKGSVLLSFKLTVGRVKIAAVDMTTNEAIACFASDDPAKLAYLYPFLLSFDYNGLGSTSSIATAVNSKTIKNMTIVMPDSNTLAEFYANTKPLYEAIMNSMLENMSLKALRDALLPKLMSGEIDVTQLNSHLAASSRRLPGHLADLRYEWQGGNQIARTGGLTYRNFGILPRPDRGQASQRRFKRPCRTSPLPKNRQAKVKKPWSVGGDLRFC